VLLRFDVDRHPGPEGATDIFLVFSENIGGFSASDLTLTNLSSGQPISPLTSYESGSQTATLSFEDPAGDSYSLVIHDDSISANGKTFDGEVDTSAWWDAVRLPSGDGTPGGDAVLEFALEAPYIPALPGAFRLGLGALLLLAGVWKLSPSVRSGPSRAG
jgi:hypothetical protein